MELAKAYDPQEAQKRWLADWDKKNLFHAVPDTRPPFSIVIPPPNVTGALHLGHALNNTLQDVLVRFHRARGENSLWMLRHRSCRHRHAGAVVERLILQTEKKTRRDLGREELVKRIWQWKDKYEARILGQLRQLGASCDWQRTRFTLDETCARAVRQTFFDMFKDGLIFRGKTPRQLGRAAPGRRWPTTKPTPRTPKAASGPSNTPSSPRTSPRVPGSNPRNTSASPPPAPKRCSATPPSASIRPTNATST